MEIFIGVIVSVIVEGVKRYVNGNQWHGLIALVGFSLIAGIAMYILKETNLWVATIQVLTYASAFWALIIRRFPQYQSK